MGVFRYESKYAAPTKEQRERYMTGEREEHTFGPEGKILLIAYDEAVYIKDDIEEVRILFTGIKDKQKAYDEVRRLLEHYEQKKKKNDLLLHQKILVISLATVQAGYSPSGMEKMYGYQYLSPPAKRYYIQGSIPVGKVIFEKNSEHGNGLMTN